MRSSILVFGSGVVPEVRMSVDDYRPCHLEVCLIRKKEWFKYVALLPSALQKDSSELQKDRFISFDEPRGPENTSNRSWRGHL
jgi:hypothetical protein